MKRKVTTLRRNKPTVTTRDFKIPPYITDERSRQKENQGYRRYRRMEQPDLIVIAYSTL